MSFVASPVLPVSPQGDVITAGDFWPAIDVNLFRDAMRIGAQAIPEPRVREALIGGIIIADDNLADWRAAQVKAGYAMLADVPSSQIAGTSRFALLWRRAVHAFAAADLIETHRDVTATAAGARNADEQAMTADDHRRNAVHAVRAILGQRRTAVELI